MGFFDKHGSFATSSGDFEVADDGIYLCRLKEVEPITRPSFENKEVQEEAFRWVFESINDLDSRNNPYRFTKFTKRAYGNEKANLTLLIDSMMGRHLTQAEFAALDLEDLMARKWRVNVELTATGEGKQINKILWVKPEKSAGAARTLAAAGATAAGSGAGAPRRGHALPDSDPGDGDPFEE